MMKRMIKICILAIALFFVIPFANAISDDAIAVITLDISQGSSYSVNRGDSAGELILDMKDYPKDLVLQLKRQFNSHFVAMQVISKSKKSISLKLIIMPANFNIVVKRRMAPQALIINIYEAKDQPAGPEDALIPPMPLWEMLVDSSVVTPEAQYDGVSGEGAAIEVFRSASHLFNIGAYETVQKRLKENLQSTSGPLWSVGLMMLAEARFRLALLQDQPMQDAIRALVIAQQEATDPQWKFRATLLTGYANYFAGNIAEAEKVFSEGAASYPEVEAYFMLGTMMVQLSKGQADELQKTIKAVKAYGGMPVKAKSKICISEMLLVLRKGEVRKANSMADACLSRYDRNEELGISQLMAVAEARVMSYRYGDAKKILSRIIRDYPDHHGAALAALRLADVLFHEWKSSEAMSAYNRVSMRWPLSPYARLAVLRRMEIAHHLDEDLEAVQVYSGLDLHIEPDPVGRESKLRLMWLYEGQGKYQMAFTYLVELVRRYNGIDYWSFDPERFSKIVLKTYKELMAAGEYLEAIKIYQAKTPFPLTVEKREEITLLIAEAFKELGRGREAIMVYQEGMDEKSRSKHGERRIILGLTKAYLSMDDTFRAEKTQEYFRSRYRKKSDIFEHYLMVAEIEEVKGRYSMVTEALKKALKYADTMDKRRTVSLRISRALYMNGKFEQTANVLRPVLMQFLDENILIDPEILPENVSQALFHFADSLFQSGKYSECLSTYSRIIEMLPEDDRVPIAMYFAAKSCTLLNLQQDAQAFYEKLSQRKEPFWKQIGQMKQETSQWYSRHQLPKLMEKDRHVSK